VVASPERPPLFGFGNRFDLTSPALHHFLSPLRATENFGSRLLQSWWPGDGFEKWPRPIRRRRRSQGAESQPARKAAGTYSVASPPKAGVKSLPPPTLHEDGLIEVVDAERY
jgi:hypothetical protein